MNPFDALCHCCKDFSDQPPPHPQWLPFWNMQTTSRLHSAELLQPLAPHHHASQTGSLLSEPIWGRKKNISNTKLCVCSRKTRGKLWLPELGWGGGGRLGSHCVPKKPKHFLFGPEFTENMERNYWTGGAIAEDNHSCHSLKIPIRAMVYTKCTDKTWGDTLRRVFLWYSEKTVDFTNFCPEGVSTERIWISPPSFFYGTGWFLLHRASHMEEIYPICLAQQDGQHAAPQFTSI